MTPQIPRHNTARHNTSARRPVPISDNGNIKRSQTPTQSHPHTRGQVSYYREELNEFQYGRTNCDTLNEFTHEKEYKLPQARHAHKEAMPEESADNSEDDYSEHITQPTYNQTKRSSSRLFQVILLILLMAAATLSYFFDENSIIRHGIDGEKVEEISSGGREKASEIINSTSKKSDQILTKIRDRSAHIAKSTAEHSNKLASTSQAKAQIAVTEVRDKTDRALTQTVEKINDSFTYLKERYQQVSDKASSTSIADIRAKIAMRRSKEQNTKDK